MAGGKINITEKDKEELFKNIYSGKVTLNKLPKELYNLIAEELTLGLFKGLNSNIKEKDKEAVKNLKKSLYQFSAAKTYQQTKDIQNFLFEDGKIVPFYKFKKAADVIFNTYNVNWLEAEYITTVRTAQSHSYWKQIIDEKEIFPYLKYETQGDARVRDEHSSLNGVVAKIDSDFWAVNMPPNGWRCRCRAVQQKTGTETNLEKVKQPKITPVFKGNPGKRNTIFKGNHPYFNVPKKDKKLKENNFNLPLPEEQEKFVPAKTAKEANEYSKKLFKDNYGFEIGRVIKHKSVDLEKQNKYNKKLTELLNEYEPTKDNLKFNANVKPSLMFKSSESTLGYIRHAIRIDKTKSFIKTLNFGHRHNEKRILSNEEYFLKYKKMKFSSSVDKKNLEFSTVTHEFAHTLTIIEHSEIIGMTKQKKYWEELRKIRKEYNEECSKLNKEGKTEEINKIFIGRYGNTNADEFHAECFTEYKLSSKPTKYAIKTGKLIDKYFKK